MCFGQARCKSLCITHFYYVRAFNTDMPFMETQRVYYVIKETVLVRYLGRSSHHKLVDLGLSILCGCKCSDGVHCTYHGLERRRPDRSNPVSTSQFHIPATQIATNLNHIHTSSITTNNTPIKIFSLRTCRIISFFGKFL